MSGREEEDQALLRESAYGGNINEVRRLLAEKANVNSTVTDGRAPLHLSAMKGDVGLSQMLVGAGANVHATDNTGETPLHRSAANGHVSTSQVLVDAGANVRVGYHTPRPCKAKRQQHCRRVVGAKCASRLHNYVT
eukprot:CAMPEP_0175864176 /NCGR_PEP_ID=MMETSP0107_2-20121207/32916_1 /TAXON_ID=195067 ORGANISM="Goniomonas pacifica, Strain CCMP1869" /NCGR_SAMPLE_ID=MMETSP0107_2 /ASSEMBLY_ACC=CAM_ASM_000203 /LENGTH=135 /DNA_ID=CAMNT_0017181379 /DNA_START=13 /DNA_END=420 /DNA_ORIENTATION=-